MFNPTTEFAAGDLFWLLIVAAEAVRRWWRLTSTSGTSDGAEVDDSGCSGCGCGCD